MIHLLQKGFIEKYLCWFTHKEPYFPYETMVEWMVGSTSSSNNIDKVVDDNSNSYMSIVMDVMRMNHNYSYDCSIVNEKPNVDTLRCFDLLKNFNKLLWDGCTNHNKLLVVVQMFITKSGHRLSKADMVESSNERETFYLKGIG